MPILLDQMRPIAFFVVVCAASINTAVGGPVGTIGQKRTVLVFYGHPLSLLANRMIEQGLTTALSEKPVPTLPAYNGTPNAREISACVALPLMTN
jgi:hypothetical protein